MLGLDVLLRPYRVASVSEHYLSLRAGLQVHHVRRCAPLQSPCSQGIRGRGEQPLAHRTSMRAVTLSQSCYRMASERLVITVVTRRYPSASEPSQNVGASNDSLLSESSLGELQLVVHRGHIILVRAEVAPLEGCLSVVVVGRRLLQVVGRVVSRTGRAATASSTSTATTSAGTTGARRDIGSENL